MIDTSFDNLNKLVNEMRLIGKDTQKCEVKASSRGLSGNITKTLSAFSNGSGGCIILGLSEQDGFRSAPGFDAPAAQDALAAACDKLTPAIRPEIEIHSFEGSQVVFGKIPEMLPRDKPCYVTERGTYKGSFIRTGDGDRRLTNYEVDRLLEEHRRRPAYDVEMVDEATEDDLDTELIALLLKRQQTLHPRIFGGLEDRDALLDLRVLKMDGDIPRPTIGGLLALGRFPQKYFPRLNVTFSVFPGISKAETSVDGRRFLDSSTIIGSIPEMVAETVHVVEKNMRTGAVVKGAFREDIPDYPSIAIREAVANALMHRDYSPDSRGSQVQVNMYADRLEVINPGGLYGTVTIDTLGKSGTSSTRNQFLSNILETTPYPGGGYVVENRGTGYQAIEKSLNEALMNPPIAKDSITIFSLTFSKRKMSESEKGNFFTQDIDVSILDALEKKSSITTMELVEMSGLSRAAISKHMKKLVAEGYVEPTEPKNSPKQRYRFPK